MSKLTITDWESSEMDRISNNVTQEYGHELEKIVRNIFIPNWSQTMKEALIDEDQIHEVLCMIKEDTYIYEKIIEEHEENRKEMYAILKELELLHLLPEKIRKQLKIK